MVLTADGSHSLFVSELNEHYHSRHGALRESLHVFIDAGMHHAIATLQPTPLRILEVGFGTGLNAMLTAMHAPSPVEYTAIERYPVEVEQALALNYSSLPELRPWARFYEAMHRAPWEEPAQVAPHMALTKLHANFLDWEGSMPATYVAHFQLIYFDAFGYRAQPEMWSDDVFALCARLLAPGGVLVTYAARGHVKRALERAGMEVEKLPGAPPKREMMRATKLPKP